MLLAIRIHLPHQASSKVLQDILVVQIMQIYSKFSQINNLLILNKYLKCQVSPISNNWLLKMYLIFYINKEWKIFIIKIIYAPHM